MDLGALIKFLHSSSYQNKNMIKMLLGVQVVSLYMIIQFITIFMDHFLASSFSSYLGTYFADLLNSICI